MTRFVPLLLLASLFATASTARERQEIFDHITSQKIEGVILLSGDRHFAAGYQIQERFLEFTSGPLGSGNATLQENPERPERMEKKPGA